MQIRLFTAEFAENAELYFLFLNLLFSAVSALFAVNPLDFEWDFGFI
jgi:hypothetical protein